jgi:hypothetical protein
MTTLRTRLSYFWQNPLCTTPYTTGVSLHSHTSHSLETLSLVHDACRFVPLVDRMVRGYDRSCRRNRGFALDFETAHWRPPLVPRMAWDLEQAQIRSLGLRALISITDHDDMGAPLLLRTIPSARHIPLSLEWSVPFGKTAFHLGVHNLPSATAIAWMERFTRFTAHPEETGLGRLLQELDSMPQALVVLNHPQWDLFSIGEAQHARELERFLLQYNRYMHAFELNGLRHARENHEMVGLAQRWQQLVVSGGDRHGLEPNANLNLTNASSFTEYVHEVRVERRSHVLFMPQYKQPWRQRILDSTIDAVSDHMHFSPGWQRWDERAFHPDADGALRPLSELWTDGRPPLPLRITLQGARLFRSRAAARALGFALKGLSRTSRGGLEETVGDFA